MVRLPRGCLPRPHQWPYRSPPSLFTWPSDEPRLIGGACADCGAVSFPRPTSCSRCTSERDRRAPARPHRHPLELDGPALPAEGAVRRAGAVRAVRGRVRRPRRRGDRRRSPHDRRPRASWRSASRWSSSSSRSHVDVGTVHLRVPARAGSVSGPITGVAIVGIGMHPFGRTDGVSGRQQAVHAARLALGRRRHRVGPGPVRVRRQPRRRRRRHTRQRARVSPGCRSSTSGTAAPPVAARSRWPIARSARAPPTSGWRSGSTSTRAAPSTSIRSPWASVRWYGETGMMLTTQFFALKIQRYMHAARHLAVDVGQGRREGVRERRRRTRTRGAAPR